MHRAELGGTRGGVYSEKRRPRSRRGVRMGVVAWKGRCERSEREGTFVRLCAAIVYDNKMMGKSTSIALVGKTRLRRHDVR